MLKQGEQMQKDISTDAAENLAKGLNELHNKQSGEKQALISLVKRQAEEIDRRGQIIMKLEESLQQMELQGKHLQSMIDSLREERQKLVEELEQIKQGHTTKSSSKRVKKVVSDEATESIST